MESLFLLAFGQAEFLAALAGAGSKAFFNKLLVALPVTWVLGRTLPVTALSSLQVTVSLKSIQP
jgi:hypothetical protein